MRWPARKTEPERYEDWVAKVSEWHTHFVWLPLRLVDPDGIWMDQMVWLEVVNRRLYNRYTSEWEYKLKGNPCLYRA